MDSLALEPRRTRTRLALLASVTLLLVLCVAPSAARASYDASGAESLLAPIGSAFPTGTGASAVAWSPDGTILASASRPLDTVTVSVAREDGSLAIIATYPTGNGPAAVAFSPDGQMLAVANEADGTVSTFFVSKTPSLTVAQPPKHVGNGPVTLAFSPDGQYLAVGLAADKSAQVYSVAGNGTLAAVSQVLGDENYVGPVRTVRFSSRGVLVVGVDHPGQFYYFYKIGSNGRLTPTGTMQFMNSDLCDAQFSPDGNWFAWTNCYYQYDYVKVYQMNANGLPGPLTGFLHFNPVGVRALAWSRDSTLLATANVVGPINYYEPVRDIPPDSVSVFSVSAQGVTEVGRSALVGATPSSLAFGLDGLLAVGVPSGTVTVRVPRDGGPIPVGASGITSLGGTASQLAFSADGTRLATATDMFTVSADGRLSERDGGTAAAADDAGVAFSPSGDLMVRTTAAGSAVLSSGAADGTTTQIGPAHDIGARPRRVAFSPDGSLVAIIDATKLTVLRVQPDGLTYGDSQSWADSTPYDVAFQPTGHTLTVADDQARLVTFDYTASGGLGPATIVSTETPMSHTSMRAIAYNADGTLLAAADRTGDRLWLFSVGAEGQPVLLAPPFAISVTPSSVVFSSKSDALFVGGSGGTYAYAIEGNELQEVGRASGIDQPDALAISPNGKVLVTGSHGSLAVWSLTAPWLGLRVTSGPAALTTAEQATFDFSANYPSRLECRVDAGDYRLCSSGLSVSGLEDGPHVLSVRGRDLSGALQGEPVTWNWKSDVRGPRTPQQTDPAPGAANLSPTGQAFSWEATTDVVSAIDRYELWVDGAKAAVVAPSSCAPACRVTPSTALAEGDHAWAVRAYDALGHMTQTAERAFTVDATPPGAPVLAGPEDGAYVGDPRPRLAWAASQDAGAGLAGYDVLVDDRPAATGLSASESGWTPPSALTDGAHTWEVVARDGAGNAATSARRTLTVDQTPPTAALRVSPNRFVPPFKVTLDASGSADAGGIARYEFDLDGNGSYETSSATPRAETTLTTLGEHPLGVRVVDRAGHAAVAAQVVVGEAVTGKGSREASVTIDEGAEFTRSRIVSLAIQPPPRSGAVTMIIANDGRPDQTLRRPVAEHVTWALAKGDGLRDRRIVYVVFYNSAGLQVSNGRVQDDILYDPYAPTVRDAVLSITGARAARLSFRAHDRGSGLARWELKAGRRVLARRTRFKGTKKITLPKVGVGKVSLVLRDKAGNTARARVRVWRR